MTRAKKRFIQVAGQKREKLASGNPPAGKMHKRPRKSPILGLTLNVLYRNCWYEALVEFVSLHLVRVRYGGDWDRYKESINCREIEIGPGDGDQCRAKIRQQDQPLWQEWRTECEAFAEFQQKPKGGRGRQADSETQSHSDHEAQV